MKHVIRPALIAGLLLMQVACATYQVSVQSAKDKVVAGQVDEALAEMLPKASEEGKDQLAFLLEVGSIYQIKEDFHESNKYFLRADRLSEEVDYHSVSKVTASLLTSEEMIQYKGDTFEKTIINAQLALNFLALNQIDEAQVEARRINEKFKKIRQADKVEAVQNYFGLWLSGLLWELTGQIDDAFIAYKSAYEINPQSALLAKDVVRTGKISKRESELAVLKKKFYMLDLSVDASSAKSRNMGEVVVILQNGWGPRKRPDPIEPRFPLLVRQYSETSKAKVFINSSLVGTTESIYDVNEAAIKTLEEDRALLVARRLGGVVAKEVVAEQIRQKDELLGFIAAIAMHASDIADVRQWAFLPGTIQILRFPVEAGTYDIKLVGEGYSGEATSESKTFEKVTVRPREKKVLTWRTIK